MSNKKDLEKLLNDHFELVYNNLMLLKTGQPWYYEDIVEDSDATRGGGQYQHSLKVVKSILNPTFLKGFECECAPCQCLYVTHCCCDTDCENRLVGYTFSHVQQCHVVEYDAETDTYNWGNEDEWEYYDQWEDGEFSIYINNRRIEIVEECIPFDNDSNSNSNSDNDYDVEDRIIPYVKEFIELLLYEA